MDITYKKATIDDLELLTQTRIQVLRAANQLLDEVDLYEVGKESDDYYRNALDHDSHVAYLVFDGEKFVGTGGIRFYRVMPTFHNVTGRKAYVMNMYTLPAYRRQGIALKTLTLLVMEAKRRGITHITLEATAMRRKLYEIFGFVKMKDEMQFLDGDNKFTVN